MQAVSVLKRKRLAVRGATKKRRTSAIRSVVARQQRQKRSLRFRNAVTMGFLGIERKFYDTALTPTNVASPTDATSGELDPSGTSMISTPAVGDSEQNREGKKINILSVEIEGYLNRAGAEASTGVANDLQCMVALVLDTQTNAAQLNSEDVFKNTSASAQLAHSPVRNLLFASRFQVLKKKVFNLDNPSVGYAAANDLSWNGIGRKFKWFIKFPKGLVVNFNAGTTASIANVIDNSLHIIAFANTSTAGNTATLQYNARIRFVG